MTQVEQIKYSYWGSEKPEHKHYWSHIDSIALLIGLTLEKDSLIGVRQTKEKFGDARVYIDMVDQEKALEAYNKLHGAELTYENLDDPKYAEFCEKAELSSAKHYRATYLMFFDLFPQYKSAIYNGADKGCYLKQTKEEYDAWLAAAIEKGYYQAAEKQKVYQVCGWSDK